MDPHFCFGKLAPQFAVFGAQLIHQFGICSDLILVDRILLGGEIDSAVNILDPRFCSFMLLAFQRNLVEQFHDVVLEPLHVGFFSIELNRECVELFLLFRVEPLGLFYFFVRLFDRRTQFFRPRLQFLLLAMQFDFIFFVALDRNRKRFFPLA